MRRVIVESPFRARTRARFRSHLEYLTAAMRDSIDRGEAPYASHLLYPGALDDRIPAERALGIQLGYEWWAVAEAICFYLDLGWSDGMVQAKLHAKRLGMPVEERSLDTYANRNTGHGEAQLQ